MIEPIAKQLNIANDNIYANTILFNDKGNGFDEEEYTSADYGKQRVMEHLQSKCGYEMIVMVGDGVTDAQARPPAKAFLGYGGVVVRASVR